MGIQSGPAKAAMKNSMKKEPTPTTLTKLSKDFYRVHKRKPVAGIDVSVWIMGCINNNRSERVVEQFHSIPLVPVTRVSKYVIARTELVCKAGFEVLLVFDGCRNPLKKETNSKRSGDLIEKRRKLEHAYNNPTRHIHTNTCINYERIICHHGRIFMQNY